MQQAIKSTPKTTAMAMATATLTFIFCLSITSSWLTFFVFGETSWLTQQQKSENILDAADFKAIKPMEKMMERQKLIGGFQPRSTDTAGRVPHRCPTRGAATDAAAITSVLCLSFFFSFFSFFFLSYRFEPTRLQFMPTQLRFGTIHAEPGRFGQNRVVSAESDRICRRPKLTEIGLESCRNSRNRPKSKLCCI